MANQVDFKILPSDQFSVHSPATRSEKIITYFTLLSKLRGDILSVGGEDDPNDIVSAYYTNVGGTQTLHLVKADGSEVTASQPQQVISGTVNYVSKFTTSNDIGNSQIFDNGTNVGIGTTTMTHKLQLGTGGVFADYYQLDTTYSNGFVVGAMSWDSDNGTMDVGLSGSLKLKVGQDDMWYVKNQTGSTITKGTAVYASGTLGASSRITVAPMIANGTIPARFFLGIVAEDIINGADGYVLARGKIRGISTNAYNEGDVLWVSPTTAGALTATEPTAPNLKLPVAFVVYKASNGVLAVRATTGTKIADASDVDYTGAADNSILVYNSATGVWEDETVGIFKTISVSGQDSIVADSYNDTLTISAGTGISLTTAASTDTLTITNSAPDQIVSLTGAGTTVVTGTYPDFTITSNDEHTGTVTSITASSPLTGGTITTTGTIGINKANAITDGYLSATDWSTFNNKATLAFRTIAVYGQSNVVADSSAATLTLVAGSNVTITTNASSDSITISADTGASGSGTANYISKWATSSSLTNSVIYEDSGYIGIGTTSPAEKLQVNGMIRITNLTYSGIEYHNINGTPELYIGTEASGGGARYNSLSSKHTFYNNSSAVVTITSTGSVGIGTTNPSAKLHVVGDAILGGGTDISPSALGAGQLGIVGLGYKGYVALDATAMYFGHTSNSRSIIFQTNAGDRVAITASGDLGVGTSSPSQKLHVVGSAHITGALYDSSNSSGTAGQVLTSTGTGFSWSSGSVSGSGTTNYVAKWSGAATLADSLLFSSSTAVGIGTAVPNYKLEVIGGSTIFGDLYAVARFDQDKTNNRGIVLGYNASGQFGAIVADSAGLASSILFVTNSGTGFVESMRVTSDKVGIFRQTPTYTLDVAGTFRSNNFFTLANGRAYWGPDGVGYGYLTWDSGYAKVAALDANTLYLGGTNQITILSTGNVGIGQTTPTQKLHVEGSIRVTGAYYDSSNAVGTNGQVLSSTGTGTAWVNALSGAITGSGTTNYLSKFTGSSSIGNSIVYDSGTNVGIGNVAPNQKLEISVGNGVTGGLRINYAAAATTEGMDITYLNTGNTTTSIDSRYGSNLAVMQFRMRTATASPVTAMTILGSGNVGIGTTSPSYAFEVSGTSYFRNLAWFANTAVSGSAFRWGSYGAAVSADTMLTMNQLWTGSTWSIINTNLGTTYLNLGAAAAAPNIEFGTGATNTVATTKMIITNAGNVGIGNTNPTQALHVTGSVRVTGAYYDSANAAGTSGQILSSTGTGTAWVTAPSSGISGGGTTNYVAKWTSGTAIGNSSIFDNGNVGIGTTGPTSKFQVNNSGGTGSAFYVDAGNPSGTTVLFEHTGVNTPVPFAITKSGYSGNSGDFGILYIDMAHSVVGGGSNMHFTLRDSGGNRTEYGGLGASIISNTDGAESGILNFYTTNAGSTRNIRMVISPAGNVGIGNTAPDYKLDVSSSARVYGVRIGRDFSIANRATVRLDSNGNNPADILFGQTTAANQSSWEGVYWSISSRNSGVGESEGNRFVIYRGSAHAAPNNSEAQIVTITPDLNIGIGQASPSQKLHVTGNIRVTGAYYDSANSAGSSGQILSSTGTGTAWINASGGGGITGSGTTNYVTKWTGSGSVGNSSIYDNGNVGIGTTAPQTKLNIDIGAGGANGIAAFRVGATSNYPSLELGIVGDYGGMIRSYGNDLHYYAGHWRTVGLTATEDHSHYWYTSKNGSTDWSTPKMELDHNGNLGIGTTSPNAKLNVRGTEGSASVNPQEDLLHVGGNELGGVGGYAGIRIGGASNTSYGTYIRGVKTTAYGNYWNTALTFSVTATNTETTVNEVMRITSGGNVGIGTTSPGGRLHIATPDPATNFVAIDFRNPTYGIYGKSNSIPSRGNTLEFTATDYNTNGSVVTREVLTLRPEGAVGIGTTSPSTKLHVSGGDGIINNAFIGEVPTYTSANAQFSHTSRAGAGEYSFLSASDGETFINSKTGYNIRFRVNNTDQVIINSSGNVGIGTTAPQKRLEVISDSNNFVSVGVNQIGIGNWTGIHFGYREANSFYRKSAIVFERTDLTANDAQGKIHILNGPQGSNGSATLADAKLTIAENGNVGIGTTSPSFSLSVDRATTATAQFNTNGNMVASFRSSTVAANAWAGLKLMGDEGSGIWFSDEGGTHNHGYISQRYTGQLDFATGTDSTAAATVKMTILSGGNVGIATTAPLQRLHVVGAVVGGNTATTGTPNPTGVTTQLAFEARSTQAGNDPSIAYHKENVYTMYLQGQNSPRGLRLYSPSNETTANFYVQGDVVAFSSSDRRLKDNLSPIPNALDKVSKLTGYEFDWNENQNAHSGHDYGVVAQEVEDVFPELVQTREDGYKAVKYDKIVAVLIEAIKEQQKQIDELKAKLK